MGTIDFNGSSFLGSEAKGQRYSQATSLGEPLWRQRLLQPGYQFMPVMLAGIQLWNPVIRLTARRAIISTLLDGKPDENPNTPNGMTVKEYVGDDDFVINIRGIIKNTDGLWPDQEISELTRLWRRSESVSINNALTSHFMSGWEYVVITNLNIPENPGKVESVLYEIECVSDNPFVLELEGNEPTL